jgi:hypothetical protein
MEWDRRDFESEARQHEDQPDYEASRPAIYERLSDWLESRMAGEAVDERGSV